MVESGVGCLEFSMMIFNLSLIYVFQVAIKIALLPKSQILAFCKVTGHKDCLRCLVCVMD